VKLHAIALLLALLKSWTGHETEQGGRDFLSTGVACTQTENRVLSFDNDRVVSCSLATSLLWKYPARRTLTQLTVYIHLQASSLSRLRHPCILEMAEPMEETRCVSFASFRPLSRSPSLTALSQNSQINHHVCHRTHHFVPSLRHQRFRFLITPQSTRS
jgi:hypothetical protein